MGLPAKKLKRVVVESDYLTEGLFGQILICLLEVTYVLQQFHLRPGFIVRSKNYGCPKTGNIFPGVIQTNYVPESLAAIPLELSYAVIREKPNQVVLSLEVIKKTASGCFSNKHGFLKAAALFQSYFRFPADLSNGKDIHKQSSGAIGIHYRGTDKITETTQTNRIESAQFLIFAENLIRWKKPRYIYVASDEPGFIQAMKQKYGPKMLCARARATKRAPGAPFRGHKPSRNISVARQALIDSLNLSRCAIVLQNCSALACFAKIFNPKSTVYRCAAMKQNWFPLAYTKVIPSVVIGDHQEEFIQLMKHDVFFDRSFRSMVWRHVYFFRLKAFYKTIEVLKKSKSLWQRIGNSPGPKSP